MDPNTVRVIAFDLDGTLTQHRTPLPAEIRARLETLPSAVSLTELLREIGCPCTPREIGVDAPVLRDTFLYCKEVRARYTLLQLVYDLGLLEELAGRVIARSVT